ncbi:MAG: 6-phosphogluconolactonase [Gammaproteobacteria bacterium]
MSQYPVHIYNGVDALSRAAAQRWIELADQAIQARGQFHIALSGGTTPRSLYERLTAPEFAGRVDWRHVHVWFGDERSVPPDHPDSNYRMACEALLSHVPIPPTQVHRIEAEKDGAAQAYEALITASIPSPVAGVAQFDLILLGLGPDGHVASLFPDTAILQERIRQVAAVYVDKLNTWRISLTLPVIDNARHIMIFVAGAGKAEIMRQILTEDPRTVPYPVQMIRPAGMFDWYLDAAAAQALPEAQP